MSLSPVLSDALATTLQAQERHTWQYHRDLAATLVAGVRQAEVFSNGDRKQTSLGIPPQAPSLEMVVPVSPDLQPLYKKVDRWTVSVKYCSPSTSPESFTSPTKALF